MSMKYEYIQKEDQQRPEEAAEDLTLDVGQVILKMQKWTAIFLGVLHNNRPLDLDRCYHSKQHLHFNVILWEGLACADRQMADIGTATAHD